jgi:hypothetical protein
VTVPLPSVRATVLPSWSGTTHLPPRARGWSVPGPCNTGGVVPPVVSLTMLSSLRRKTPAVRVGALKPAADVGGIVDAAGVGRALGEQVVLGVPFDGHVRSGGFRNGLLDSFEGKW